MDNTKSAFVIMPFSETETYTESEWTDIYENVFRPAFEACGYPCERGIPSSGSLVGQIIEKLKNSTIVLADITNRHPNVMYELGVRHSISMNTIVASQRVEDIPSDLRGYWSVIYGIRPGEVQKFKGDIGRILSEIEQNPDKSDSPVSDYLGKLNGRLKSIEEQIAKLAQAQNMKLHEDLRKAEQEIKQLKSENEALQLRVNPPWKSRNFAVDSRSCFLLMPFSTTWSDAIWKTISEVVAKYGLFCRRADEEHGRIIMEDIWEAICKASVIIADLTGSNPNVTYEVGLADVLGKEIVLLCQKPYVSKVPFDFVGQRLIIYEDTAAGVRRLSDGLERKLSKIKKLSS